MYINDRRYNWISYVNNLVIIENNILKNKRKVKGHLTYQIPLGHTVDNIRKFI